MAKKYTRKGHKTRSAGRFGVRYGRKNRKLVANIEERMRQGYKCPKCGQMTIRRTDTGIWNCKKCDHTFTGGTYVPQTSMGLAVTRSVKKAMDTDITIEDLESETEEMELESATEEVTAFQETVSLKEDTTSGETTF